MSLLHLPLADVLAGATGIFLLILISQSSVDRDSATFTSQEQENSGTSTFAHSGEVEYNGQMTLPILIYRDFFIVPAANEQLGETRRYDYQKIASYPELRGIFSGYFGANGQRVTQIWIEPSPYYNQINVYLQNPYSYSTTVDHLEPGCRFVLDEESKRFFCDQSQ